jgi:hypothetical protein
MFPTEVGFEIDIEAWTRALSPGNRYSHLGDRWISVPGDRRLDIMEARHLYSLRVRRREHGRYSTFLPRDLFGANFLIPPGRCLAAYFCHF